MQRLYAVGPDEFLATRRQLVQVAKAAGASEAAAEIGRLRKPSVAAWAVNLVARAHPERIAELVDVGTRMRLAQSHLDTATLSALRPSRDALVAAFTAAAHQEVAAAGRSLSSAGQQEVRDTVIAALASEDASAAVVSGQLTRSLSYSGFGEVDVSEAVARTSSGSILTVLQGQRSAAAGAGDRRTRSDRGSAGATARVGEGDEAAPADADDADAGDADRQGERAALAAELELARSRLAEAESALSAARERAAETRERLAVVERQLAKARAADDRAAEAVAEAVGYRKDAEAAVAQVESALGDAG